MEYSGILFALLATLSWSFCIFPFTQAARRLGSNSLNHFRLLLATILIGIISILISPLHFAELFSSPYQQAWIWLGVSGVLGLTIGDYFGFGMYAILGPRLGSVLTTFAPAAALILGTILLDEHISLIGIIGMLITILGVIAISLGKSERVLIPDHGHGSISKGVIFGILAAVCQGAGLVLAKKGLQSETEIQLTINPVHATFIRLFIGTGSLYILSFFQGKLREIYQPILNNRENGIKYAVYGTFFGPALGVTLALFSVSRIDASVAQTIFSLVPVGAIVLAFILHKERINSRSLFGVVIAILGVLILIWREKLNQLF
ncbi:MAG: DMT family transporter [Bacteroidetes bacterium]|nr:DMT family transporter [Bacteroidota bacterium]MBK9525391.1 DMT family transporter [Bacteroidota bacterium]MBK9542338.1 DMT family transporter [Bacteroidota bacterium]MBP6402682.1 DMT family transporter [Bacteroidia bacterium]MBP6648266.1 DMT family transporter [Bacteroidia bacterium]